MIDVDVPVDVCIDLKIVVENVFYPCSIHFYYVD